MDKKELTKRISAHIADYVVATCVNAKQDEQHWQQYYTNCISDIQQEIKEAENSVKDFKEDGLSFSAIEQEGYLRGMRYMLRCFEKHKPQ